MEIIDVDPGSPPSPGQNKTYLVVFDPIEGYLHSRQLEYSFTLFTAQGEATVNSSAASVVVTMTLYNDPMPMSATRQIDMAQLKYEGVKADLRKLDVQVTKTRASSMLNRWSATIDEYVRRKLEGLIKINTDMMFPTFLAGWMDHKRLEWANAAAAEIQREAEVSTVSSVPQQN